MNNSSTRTVASERPIEKSPSLIDKSAKHIVLQLMAKLKYGTIILQDGQDTENFGTHPGPSVHVFVKDHRMFRKILLGGSIGAGEAYIEKMWEVDDLTALVQIMTLNMDLLDKMEQGFAWILHPFRLAHHKMKRNTKTNSKKNILSHYDLGNEMYKTFLDPTMMYSSARYTKDINTLEEASLYKLDLICQKLGLTSSDRVIEIGAGWCGFAIYAAKKYGCHITTTTISDAQYEEGKKRIVEARLTDKITLLKKDYRELTGKYDKLVSIEMIEAVGCNFLPEFFKQCNQLLKPDGKMLLQAITITDQKYSQYLTGVDFIQRHIFPGGCLPSNSTMFDLITRHTNMIVRHLDDFGFDYARTIQEWRLRFNNAFPSLRQHGYDETFQRLWNFYLCYCEGGFTERAISVVHLVATKPDNRDTVNV